MSMQKKSLLILMGLVVVVGVVLVLLFVFEKKQIPRANEATLPVAASFYLYEDFLKEIGGDRIRIVAPAPRGIDAHEIEPSPRDIAAVLSAQLFVTHGAGLDPWAERMSDALRDRGVNVVTMSTRIPFDITHTDERGAAFTDPHIWLDPLLVQKAIEVLRDTLMEMDPSHVDLYTQNAERLTTQLTQLHAEFTSGLAQCLVRDIIIAHDAFAYLAQRYNITTHSIAGNNPEAEPSAQRLSTLVELAREKNISVILTEPLEPAAAAETIAKEIGATTLILHTLEGLTETEQEAGETYMTLMVANLINLRIAMRCS